MSDSLSMLFNPPLASVVGVFSQLCRLAALAILLPIFLVGLLDFAGYAVFRTLGLHRQRVRIAQRPLKVYPGDRGRPTDGSLIPSIEKAPLLSPGTYDASTLLRHRARSLSQHSDSNAYFARVNYGVDGPLGLVDTDADESGTESGRNSPVARRSEFMFTPVKEKDSPASSGSWEAVAADLEPKSAFIK